MLHISDLCTLLETYLEPEQVAEVFQAYLFSAEAHDGQLRISGEPYIFHPLAVAYILAEMHMDAPSIIAALLHDVIEDTPTAKKQIAEQFGSEVAELVDGVSKLTSIRFESKAEAQAENFRKMILAMTRDLRVIIIKLADRLHNMRTLEVLRPDKQRRIARETLDIYAPIASRLGMNRLRLELEDLGFAAHYPMRRRVLAEAVKKARGNRREIIGKIETALKGRLQQEGVNCRVTGREKHLLSLYKKMRSKNLFFHEVMDVYAFRITVDRVDTCYRTLGIVHNLYKPVPGKFKDYIAIPKANGYQSLHTILFGPYGVPIEVQIRTEEMDRLAEAGIAAHWLYKTGDGGGISAQARAREWLKNLLEMQQSAGNSLEFLESVKVDLFPDEVYVFTPRGEIMELPRGATAIDFAYDVHTDVGNSCVAVKIDRRLMPLSTQLANGQTVEVITAPGARPNPTWLNFVSTAKARTNIRSYLKNQRHDETIDLGRQLMEQAMTDLDETLLMVPKERIEAALQEMNLESMDELLEQIGLGNRMAPLVARLLVPADALTTVQGTDARPLYIKGTEGAIVTFAKCCRPIPGDSIMGFLSTGRGITIHTQTCKNIADYRKQPEKWINVQWAEGINATFPSDLRVEVTNQRGALATVASVIANTDANIENVSLEDRDGIHTAINLTVAVRDRIHLARIIRNLRALNKILKVSRGRA
ncbi:MAG: bifunctional GTP diphosphokinase/guanosine-3',5'-bis pyrophosphate 3'-pyrophosphohydrolase [Thiohalomonadaceae bacterium]